MSKEKFDASKREPAPAGDGVVVLDLVMEDLARRAETGKAIYGTFLRTHNGRNPLIDAYQEALDLAMYLRQLIYEQQANKTGGE